MALFLQQNKGFKMLLLLLLLLLLIFQMDHHCNSMQKTALGREDKKARETWPQKVSSLEEQMHSRALESCVTLGYHQPTLHLCVSEKS